MNTPPVLDVGCGTLKRGSVGVDLERASSADVIADAHFLPFHSDCFSGCYAFAILEHTENPLQVVREINRVLKANAWMKIRVPRDSRLRFDTFIFFGTLQIKQLRQQYAFLKKGEHKYQYSPGTLMRILRQNGFTAYRVPFSSMRRETQNHLLVDFFEYVRNIYLIALKTTDIAR